MSTCTHFFPCSKFVINEIKGLKGILSDILSYKDLDPSLTKASVKGVLNGHLLKYRTEPEPEIRTPWEKGQLRKVLLAPFGVSVESTNREKQKGFGVVGKTSTFLKFSAGELSIWKFIRRDGLSQQWGEGRCFQHLTDGPEMLNLPQEPGQLQTSSSYAACGVTLRGACWTSNHQLPHVSKGLGPVLGAGVGGWGGWESKVARLPRWQTDGPPSAGYSQVARV